MEKSIISDQKLEEIHIVQLNMAKEVKRICELHNIDYFLIAGTLLGAVRHGGFIPWDDDMDIGMLREDYDKFIKHAKEDLKDGYYLQTWDTDKNFVQPFAKIRKNGTLFVEAGSVNVDYHKGIYIDIFPYDNVPENKIDKSIHKFKLFFLRRLILLKAGYNLNRNNNLFKKIVYTCLNYISGITSIDRYKDLIKKNMTKYNKEKTDNIVTVGGSYGYEGELIKRKWAKDLIDIKFEDEKFKCFKEFQEYLTDFYGDYMSPPPEDKRNNRHGIVKLKL